MEIFIPRHSGFCPGVKKAEQRLFHEKNNTQDAIHILGHFIHNSQYIQYLHEQGLKTVHDLFDAKKNDKIVIRTHGIPKQLEEKIKKRHPVLDLTCYTVKNLQLKLQEYSKNGYYIVLTGKKDHPEVLGLISYADASYVIETPEDIKNFLERKYELIDASRFKKILIASQTTGDEKLFERTCEELIQQLAKEYKVELLNSICPITTIREREALIIQKKVDITFVIGDPKSSNSKKIFEILKKHNPNTYFIVDLDSLLSLKLDMSGYKKAQVVSSSSTPEFVQYKICSYLESI